MKAPASSTQSKDHAAVYWEWTALAAAERLRSATVARASTKEPLSETGGENVSQEKWIPCGCWADCCGSRL